MKKIKILFEKYHDPITYLFFGVLTTIVNYVVYFPCYNLLNLGSSLSNAIAWVFSVAFAFVTNKPFVFGSHDWSRSVVLPELTKFLGCRIGSGLAETLILLLTVDILRLNGNIWKIITSILVVIVNYVGSKIFVFRKK